jgi:hypothetical protein
MKGRCIVSATKKLLSSSQASMMSKTCPIHAAFTALYPQVKPSHCGKMAEHAIKMEKKRFIGMCPGPSGMIENLELNHSLVEAAVDTTRAFPILDLGSV